MCRRFMAVGVNVTDSSNEEAALEVACRDDLRGRERFDDGNRWAHPSDDGRGRHGGIQEVPRRGDGVRVTQDDGKGNARWVNVRFPDGGVSLTLTTFLGDHLQSVEPTDQISDDLYGPGSGVKWFRCADPDGNVLTFAQSK